MRTKSTAADAIKAYAAANPIPAFAAIGIDLAPRNGSGEFVGLCPGHDDTTPSLRVNPAKGVHCDACGFGGTIIDVAIKKWGAGSFGDIKDRLLDTLGLNSTAGAPTDGRKILHEIAYEIRGLRGELVATHHRQDFDDGTKKMWWPKGTKPRELPLYGAERLADFPDGAQVVVCEGEKAADALWDKGFLAVGSVTGAAAIPCDESLKSLTRFRVRLWPDGDDAGRQHVARIAGRLVALGANVRIVKWEDAPPGGDAADFSGDVQALIEAADLPRAGAARPEIYLDAPPRTQTRLALEALTAANVPPRLFNQNGIPCRLRPSDADRPASIEALDSDDLLSELVEVADFFTNKENPGPVYPSVNLIKTIRGRGDLPFPTVDAIVQAPFFTRQGELVLEPGYHSGARTYLDRDASLANLEPIPRRPTEADLAKARDRIRYPLRQFPFVGLADYAAAVALGQIAFIREMVPGPVPIVGVSSPIPRTGKGRAIKTACAPGLGRVLSVTPELPAKEDEARKVLTSIAIKGGTYVWFDNVNHIVRGGPLAGFLTATSWQDRILGGNRLTDVPLRVQPIVCGNVLSYSREIRRRTLPLELDARTEHPERKKFQEPLDPENYSIEHRSELVWAHLVLVQNWLARGCPAGSYSTPWGGFEHYARVVGGILYAAGIEGFLENLDSGDEDDREAENWRPFFASWWGRYGDSAVLPAMVLPLVGDLLISKPDESERARSTRLGLLLPRKLGVVYDVEAENGSGRRTLQLIRKPYDRGEGRKSLGWALSDITAPPEFKRADLETDLAVLPAADDADGKPSRDEEVANREPPAVEKELSPAPADEDEGELFSEDEHERKTLDERAREEF